MQRYRILMNTLSEHYYALVMAGGGGTRLWPLSRQSHPKQMLPLVDENQSMFQMTVRRLQPLLTPERIYVVTGQDMVERLQNDVPEIPAENYIIEPFGKNSGPAAGLGSMVIAEKDPDAIIATLSADHYIAHTARYRDVLLAAAQLAAEQEMIVTLGVSPSRPATQFGYIKRGDLLGHWNNFEAFKAANFTEKPRLQKAIEFLSSGLYSWNSGMFIWQASNILQEFERQQPQIYRLLEQMKPAFGQPDFSQRITPLWEQMPGISLDYAIMEDAPNIAVIPVDIGWSDVGSWDLLFEILQGNANGNVARGKDKDHILIDTSNTMVVSDRMVVTIGVDDLVVVDTDDVVLVCHRNRAQDVREVVRQLRDRGADTYL
jgi:mannose-1-phosphate guanylyltransferase